LKAVTLDRNRQVTLTDVPVPTPTPREVLARVSYCGICGTDLHAPDNSAFVPPVVMGHEFSGTIAEVGSEVDGWNVGDRFVANPNGHVCGTCWSCRTGRDNLCEAATKKRDLGVAVDGGMTEYVALDPAYLNRIPDSLSLKTAAWVEPLGVAVRAVKTSGTGLGSRIAVIGVGAVGQLVSQVARSAGASEVLVVETSSFRSEVALDLGAAQALTPGEAAEYASHTASQNKYDIVFECSGAPSSLQLAIDLCRPGGAVRLVGMSPTSVSFDAVSAIMKEVNILTGFIYTPEEFREGIPLLASGQVNVERLTSRVVLVDDFKTAFAAMRQPENTVKVLITPTQ